MSLFLASAVQEGILEGRWDRCWVPVPVSLRSPKLRGGMCPRSHDENDGWPGSQWICHTPSSVFTLLPTAWLSLVGEWVFTGASSRRTSILKEGWTVVLGRQAVGQGLRRQANPSSYSATRGVTPFSESLRTQCSGLPCWKLSSELSHLCNVASIVSIVESVGAPVFPLFFLKSIFHACMFKYTIYSIIYIPLLLERPLGSLKVSLKEAVWLMWEMLAAASCENQKGLMSISCSFSDKETRKRVTLPIKSTFRCPRVPVWSFVHFYGALFHPARGCKEKERVW